MMIVDPITPKRRTPPRLLVWIIAIDTVVAGAVILWIAAHASHQPRSAPPPGSVAPPPASSPVTPPVIDRAPPPQR